MMILKRKQIVIVSLAVLIAVAGYLNWSYNSQNDIEEMSKNNLGEVQLVSGDAQVEDNFFVEARLDREVSRSKAVETLQTVIKDEKTEQVSKERAEQEVINMAKVTDNENTVESLVKAKGFEDAVVYITDGKVNALVKANGMTSIDAAKIQEIITSVTGITAENVKIVEVK